jgi:hypothetical protein
MNNKINLNTVTFGSDPEFFIFDNNNSEYYPSCGFIGGTKKLPIYIEKDLGYQEDNVTVEINVPPTRSSIELFNNVKKVLEHIKYKNDFPNKGLTIKCDASAIFNPEHLKSEQAQTFGCDPSILAWTGEERVIKCNNPFLRSCGGHLHIGYENHNKETNIQIVRLLDLYLGVPSVILDSDFMRKSIYGNAGDFRHQKYGLEYRTLSNFWLKSQFFVDWVFNNTMSALERYNSGFEISDNLGLAIQNAINENDTQKALFIIEKVGIEMPQQIKEVEEIWI